jgi:hypothetical protein
MFSGCEVSGSLDQKPVVIVLLAIVVACVILPSARATVPITVTVNPQSPSPNTGFTVSGRFVGYGSGVNWVMYFDPADTAKYFNSGLCVPTNERPAYTGTTGQDGAYSAQIPGQAAGTYMVEVRDDFGDDSGRVCFAIGLVSESVGVQGSNPSPAGFFLAFLPKLVASLNEQVKSITTQTSTLAAVALVAALIVIILAVARLRRR